MFNVLPNVVQKGLGAKSLMYETHDAGRHKPLDRRVRRTRQAIKSSLLKLMKEKSLQEITVKEVMEHADVNRATFYAHFSNLEDLVKSIETDMAEQVIQTAERSLRENASTPDRVFFAFDEVLANREICQWLTGEQSTGYGKKLICDYARERFVPELMSRNGLERQEALYVFDYLYNGSFGMLARWCAAETDEERGQAKLIIRRVITATFVEIEAQRG